MRSRWVPSFTRLREASRRKRTRWGSPSAPSPPASSSARHWLPRASRTSGSAPSPNDVKEHVAEIGQEAVEHGKQVAQDVAQSAAETAGESATQHAEDLRDAAQEHAQTVTGDPSTPS